jgi:hypothetical protein
MKKVLSVILMEVRLRIRTRLLISVLLVPLTSQVGGQAPPSPIRHPVIDMHLHVYASDPRWEKRIPNPVTGVSVSATNEDAHWKATLEQMRRLNVVLAVISNGNNPMTLIQQR